jgi:predicted RNA-binding protein YlqC (UPF0109 family)
VSDVDDFGDDDANTLPGGTARSVLAYLVESIVDDPDGVEVELDEGGSKTRLNVTVSPGDMGRVIGKRGRVANAIRTVVRAAAARDELDVDVEFVD